ncbi:MAG: GHKL domain-containing protein [Bacteriovoracaceae bacterium]|nr:GHKL domain-containing protein [Bacteriovoracaceae bacterium]
MEQVIMQDKKLQHTQMMEALGTLAGGVAHDFNNVLTVITCHLDLMRESIDKDDKELHLYLGEMYQASSRATSLVNQLLTYCRCTEEVRRTVELSDIIHEVYQFMKTTLPCTIKINLNNKITSSLMSVDPTRIHQILMNLCVNAMHAIGQRRDGVINLALDRHENMYVLSVKDNGEGIKQSIINKIFHPFFTTKKTGQGTGLGLSVVHGIVEEYEGKIHVESVPSVGSQFKVFLPAC